MEISAAQFKAQCLKLMDDVARTHETVVITKRGRPVARLIPVEVDARPPLFGCMAGTVTYEDDIVAPLDAGWEVLTDSGPSLFPGKRRSPAGGRKRG